MKKLSKIFLIIVVVFLAFGEAFANFESTINIDKNKIDINDSLNLTISIKTNVGGNIEISQVKGLENFDVLSQSQSQTSSSQISILNGKTQNETLVNYNYNLVLQAKKKGIFEIGPANITQGTNKITTNSVKIEVVGDKLFLNGSNSQSNQNNNQNNNIQQNQNSPNVNGNNSQNDEKIEDFSTGIEKKDFSSKDSFYLLIVLILIGVFIIFYIKNNNEKIKNLVIKTIDKSGDTDNNENKNFDKISFEKQEKEIIYPNLTEKDFIEKIDNIFKTKISKKYEIKNIENKTYEEILNSLVLENKEELNYIISLLNKAKYSNIISDRDKLLDLIKNL